MSNESKFVNARGELKPIKSLAFDDEGNEIIRVPELAKGTKLIVKTKNSTYNITVVDPEKCDLLIQGGTRWQEETPIGFAGSNWGGSILSQGGIGVGMYMELWPEGSNHRVITTAVRSIQILDHS